MSSRMIPALAATLAFIFFSFNPYAQSQPASRGDCERLYAPQYGQAGKDVIWIPTSDELVNRMLKIAGTTAEDYVIDLGSGDGKIVIAAARDFGARGLGIEYDPKMVELANCLARVENVADRAQIRRGDIFKEDFTQADVVTLYLLESLNLCIRHRLLAMRPGTRIASHSFQMGEWEYDDKASLASGTAYLWIVPARVDGKWSFSEGDGGHRFDIRLSQSFQKIDGEALIDGTDMPLQAATLIGNNIWFSFEDGRNIAYSLTGKIRDGAITGMLKTSDGTERLVSGAIKGMPVGGDWTRMAPGCSHHYDR